MNSEVTSSRRLMGKKWRDWGFEEDKEADELWGVGRIVFEDAKVVVTTIAVCL